MWCLPARKLISTITSVTNIVGTVPVAGGFLQRLIVGGSEYGHLTLARFYALLGDPAMGLAGSAEPE